jgi:hypothetical protein
MQVTSEREIDMLIAHPSTFKWEIEIRRILQGEREYALIQLISIKSYIEKIIARCPDKPKAESTFHRALKQIIESWKPIKSLSNYHISHLLDLIAAFTPEGGLSKIIEFIKIDTYAHYAHHESKRDHLPGNEDTDLHRKAILTLGNYFINPMARKGRSFEIFSKLLIEHLALPEYASLAAGNIVQLGILPLDDQRILNVLASNTTALEDILTQLLSMIDNTELPSHLGHLYSHCLDIAQIGESGFVAALQKRNILLEKVYYYGVRIKFPTGEIMKLIIPDSDDHYLHIYMINVERDAGEGYTKLMDLTKEGVNYAREIQG